MNEEELKAIWQKNENLSLENIDFERIKQLSLQSQQKLRRKIIWDIAITALVNILCLPVFWSDPKLLIIVPVMTAIWVWYLWEMNRLYKLETDIQKFDSLKDFLLRKQTLLQGYIKRSRYIAYISSPFLFLLIIFILTPFEKLIEFWLRVLVSLIFTQIIIVILIELWLHGLYHPPLDETEDLLRQLNETQ